MGAGGGRRSGPLGRSGGTLFVDKQSTALRHGISAAVRYAKPPKKAAAKKASAKSTSAKKSPAKKGTARKPASKK